jgi:hypothetical protein
MMNHQAQLKQCVHNVLSAHARTGHDPCVQKQHKVEVCLLVEKHTNAWATTITVQISTDREALREFVDSAQNDNCTFD